MIVAQKGKQFPEYEAALRSLIDHHDETSIEPLLLAIYYAPDEFPEDVYLFEVIKQYGYDEIGPENEFVEVEYSSTPGFLLPDKSYLHIQLTNPTECMQAIRSRWPSIMKLVDALHGGRYVVLQTKDEGNEILAQLEQL